MHPMWERIEPLVPAFLSDKPGSAIEEIVPCLECVFFDWFLPRVRRDIGHAEDLTARTVEQICIYRNGFENRGPGSFRAWCYQIARNVYNDWCKSEERWGAHTVSDEEWQAHEDTMSTGDLPSQEEDEPPEVISVRNVFQMLTALEQAALAMQVIDALTDEEIAERLNSSPQAIKQARYRAKQKFRELLSADPRFEMFLTSNPESARKPDKPADTTDKFDLEDQCDDECK